MSMNSARFKTVLALGTALVASLASAPAYAQDTTADTAAMAGEGEGDGDIVVTARRRDESLQDVPVAVTAISGDALDKQGAVDITVLQKQTPSLTMQVARGSNSTLIGFIRGVGQQDPLWGFEPGVGIYVDDVYIARPQGAVLDIFDVQRIEVLRGPQGTLYGRNTIGGAVKYVTKKLGHDFSGKAKVAYGSYDQLDLIGQVTVPLGDALSIGGAVARYKRDGFGTNLTTGAEHYNKDVLAGRLSAEFDNSNGVFLRLAGDYTDDKSNARHGHREVGNGGVAAFEPLPNVYDTLAGLGDKNRVKTRGVSLTGAFELSDQLTFKSISAYRKGNTDTLIDFDNTASPILDVPAFYKDKQFSQELQLVYEGDKMQGVVGLYYLDANASGAFDTVVGLANLTILTLGQVKTKSYAAFADLNIDLSDQLKLSVGGRYTSDKRTGTVHRQNYTGIKSPTFGNSAAVAGLVRTNYTNSRTDDQFTPRVSLSYLPSDDLTLYASYGKGFKAGGFDMRGDALFLPATVNGYAPEKVDAYELGLKGAFLDRTLFVNAAAFYSDYKDQQITSQVPYTSPFVGVGSFVDNVGKSKIKGFELETRMVPSRNFSVVATFGYIDAKFEKFITYDPVTASYIDVSSQRAFQNTPKFTVSFAPTWSTDLAGGTFSITPSISHRSAYHQFEIPNRLLDENGYELIDASASWTSADDRFRLSVHGRNLANERYKIGGYAFPGALYGNSIIGFYGPPRTFTVSGEVKF